MIVPRPASKRLTPRASSCQGHLNSGSGTLPWRLAVASQRGGRVVAGPDLARPYICLLIIVMRLTCPSTALELPQRLSPLVMASRSARRPVAKERSAGSPSGGGGGHPLCQACGPRRRVTADRVRRPHVPARLQPTPQQAWPPHAARLLPPTCHAYRLMDKAFCRIGRCRDNRWKFQVTPGSHRMHPAAIR